VTVRLFVSGRVQGVGFRFFVLRRAQDLGLTGYATNLADGRVEIVARGAESELHVLEQAVRAGPRHAKVAQVEKAEISDEVSVGNTFEIR
jgi:acylphosphatase